MKFLRFNTLFLLVFLSGFGEAQGREVAEGESPQNEQCESLFCKLVQLWFGEVQEQDVIPSFDFVTIPAKGAEFKMGSPKGEPKRWTDENGKDGEQVDVTFTKDFEIMKYEVTQEEYFMVTGTNPSYFSKKKYCQGEGEYVEKKHSKRSGRTLPPSSGGNGFLEYGNGLYKGIKQKSGIQGGGLHGKSYQR